MRNRTPCPNCGTEVDGSTLGYGTDEFGEREFGCGVCVTLLSPRPWTSRDAVIRGAAAVLGEAFTAGQLSVPEVAYAESLGRIAVAIADRAVSENV